jgi:hypothetical protein
MYGWVKFKNNKKEKVKSDRGERLRVESKHRRTSKIDRLIYSNGGRRN